MIYDIRCFNDNKRYRDVEFYCSMTDYAAPSWKRMVTFDKESLTVGAGVWEFDDDEFVGTVPLWVQELFNTLYAGMEYMARTGKPVELEAA